MDVKIKTLLHVLQAIQKIDPDFPVQYAICLLEIAQNEGLSVTQLAERTNLNLSTVSRIVGALSTHRQKGTPYGLVTLEISPTERRRKEIRLSDKGKATILALQKSL